MIGPEDPDHWRTKIFYTRNGSKIAACREAADPFKTILFIDDEPIPVNFPDIGSACEYADELCTN